MPAVYAHCRFGEELIPYLPPSFPINRAFFEEEYKVANRRSGIARAKSYQIGVAAAIFGQDKNAGKHYRRTDEIKDESLFFKAHGV